MTDKQVSSAKRSANDRWDKANLKRLSLVLPVEEYNALAAHLAHTGNDNRNAFIRQAIAEKIERDS